MISFLAKIKKYGIDWNAETLSEEYFFELCKRFDISVSEDRLYDSDGFYFCLKGKHFISIDKRLKHPKRLFVMWHEFAHFLHHTPSLNETASFHGLHTKNVQEREADIFATVALIPIEFFRTKTISELIDEEGLSQELIAARQQIWEIFGF